MSVFRDAVQDCLDYDTEIAKKAAKSKHTKGSSDAEVEKFSGLRIRYVLWHRLWMASWVHIQRVLVAELVMHFPVKLIMLLEFECC